MARLHPWPVNTGTIDFIQHINVDPEIVWSRLSTAAGLETWLGTTSATIPVEPGATFSLSWEAAGWRSGQTHFGYTGSVEKVIPNVLLALNWRLPKSGLMTQLSIQLQQSFAAFGKDAGTETDVWLTHAGFPSSGVAAHEFDGHNRHWRQALGQLAADLEGRPPKPQPYVLVGLKFVGGTEADGLLVEDVAVGSPADLAGIRRDDMIRSVNGARLTTLDDFHEWIDHCEIGDSGLFDLSGRVVSVPVESVEEAMTRVRIRHEGGWSGLTSLGDAQATHESVAPAASSVK